MNDLDLSQTTLLVYGASATLAVLLVIASIGVLCLLGEATLRLFAFHRRGLARLKAQR